MLDIPAARYKRSAFRRIARERPGADSPLISLASGCQESVMERCPFKDGRGRLLYMAGSQVAGPLLWAFVFWILKTARAMGHRRLYFLSRDGQILMKIANILIEAWGWDTETRYLYSSRVSWIFASMRDFSAQETGWIFQTLPHLSLRMLAERLHTPRGKFLEILRNGGFDNENISETWERPLTSGEIARLKPLIHENKDFFMRRIREERGLLENYLRQEGILDAEAVALADVGWRCRSQDALSEILAALEPV
jgi:hypothetical protein